MTIFTPVTMFQIFLNGHVTQRNVLLVPYQRSSNFFITNEQSAALKIPVGQKVLNFLILQAFTNWNS